MAAIGLIVLSANWAERHELATRTAALRQAAAAHVLGLRGLVENTISCPMPQPATLMCWPCCKRRRTVHCACG
jgi:hypothetical protein